MDWNDVKLALGAAQFGLDYGITNNTGTVSNEQIKLVLNLAKKKNVQTAIKTFVLNPEKEI